MYANTSPPKEFFLAFLSVIIPLDVEITAIPKSFKTLGSSSALTYTRNPGLEILLSPVITRSLSTYFKDKTRMSWTLLFLTL